MVCAKSYWSPTHIGTKHWNDMFKSSSIWVTGRFGLRVTGSCNLVSQPPVISLFWHTYSAISALKVWLLLGLHLSYVHFGLAFPKNNTQTHMFMQPRDCYYYQILQGFQPKWTIKYTPFLLKNMISQSSDLNFNQTNFHEIFEKMGLMEKLKYVYHNKPYSLMFVPPSVLCTNKISQNIA